MSGKVPIIDELISGITENAVRAISKKATKMKRINQLVAKKFQKLFKKFAGVKGTQIHAPLSNGELVYHGFVLPKQII